MSESTDLTLPPPGECPISNNSVCASASPPARTPSPFSTEREVDCDVTGVPGPRVLMRRVAETASVWGGERRTIHADQQCSATAADTVALCYITVTLMTFDRQSNARRTAVESRGVATGLPGWPKPSPVPFKKCKAKTTYSIYNIQIPYKIAFRASMEEKRREQWRRSVVKSEVRVAQVKPSN